MTRASVQRVLLASLIVLLAACQSAPGTSATSVPDLGRTLQAGKMPTTTGAFPTPSIGTPPLVNPSPVFPTLAAETAFASATAPEMVGYVNDEFGYRIQVPAGSAIQAERPELVRIDLPMASGTTLSEKYLEISAASGQAGCSSPYALGFDPAALETKSVDYNGIEYLEQSGSEGAAGSVYEFTSYSTQEDGTCLSLSFVLHSVNPDVFDTPPPAFDSPAEKNSFESILQSFVWSGQ